MTYTLENLFLAWQDMIPRLEQVNSMLEVTNLIEKEGQLSLQKQVTQAQLNSLKNISKPDVNKEY